MIKDNGGPDSDKIQQARRAAFDNWYASRYGEVDRHDTWAMAAMYDALEVFNAALDCVVIELPTELHAYAGQPQEDRLLDADRNYTIKQCRDAIESTKLGIKVK